MLQRLLIHRPDDWHVHFRDKEMLAHTVPATAGHFSRALVMPNLKPGLTTIPLLEAYRARILAAIPKNNAFIPYMTLYLNESITPETLQEASKIPYVLGTKLYPAGVTTNSEEGARSLTNLYPLLEILQNQNLVLQIHGETPEGDIFEREALFIKNHLQPLMVKFPKLKIVLEHISTKAAVDFILDAPSNVVATITPHHLLYDRNQLLAGGIKPHYYCLPILKHHKDKQALQKAAASGNPKFFAGTDSAPHAQHTKENACGCAGIYSAPFALSLYAELFDKINQLPKLNDFVSRFGAEFYELPTNKESIELIKSPVSIPKSLPLGLDQVIPIAAGETLTWSINDLS